MLGICRSLRVSRLSALLVAFALTGALPLLEAHAHEREHVCRCRHGPGERCSCPTCRRAVAKARRAELESLPPCHRAAAEAALSREERDGGGVDVIGGCCGDPGTRGEVLASPGPFAAPDPVLLSPPAGAGRPSDPGGSAREVVRAPPRPPPRPAA
jgi:hypothetical protein